MLPDAPALAREAARRRDWTEALRHWTAAREHAPRRIDAWAGAAAALRAMGRLDEAAALLQQAVAHLGRRPQFSIEAARLAEAKGDRDEALCLWQDILVRYPDRAAGPAAVARLLRLGGCAGEAVAICAEARPRFAADAALLFEHARCLEAAGDIASAAQAWREACEQHPAKPIAVKEALRLLETMGQHADAAALLHEACQRSPNDPTLLVASARIAARQGRWADSAALWEQARALRPDQRECYLEGAAALRHAGRMVDAEALLGMGVARFPDHPGLALRHAATLLAAHRLVEAHARYDELRRRFPDQPIAHIGCARALVATGERDTAQTVLDEARVLLPGDPSVALEHALLPLTRTFQGWRHRAEAVRRLSRLVAEFPRFAAGHAHLVRVLAIIGQQDQAQQRAHVAMRLLPDEAAPAITAAELALDHQDPARALETARAVALRFPQEPKAQALLAQAMAANGDDAGAEALLAGIRARSAPSLDIETAFATIAQRRGDWMAAVARWTAAQQRFPAAPYLASRLHDARLHAIGDGQEVEPAPAGADGALAAMMARFESLGGRPYGCEFGLVQRTFGAHPLGLLRWTRSDPAMVADAMEARFAGVGSPDQIKLRVLKGGMGEYIAQDTRFGFKTHTFVRKRDVDATRMHRQMCMRQQFLAERLLAQLAEGTRIFVYKNTLLSTSDADLDRLYRTFRSLSPGTLLLVRRARSPAMNGTVERAAPGLLVGYLTQFNQTSEGWRSAPSLATWRQLCTEADRLAPPGEINPLARAS